MTRSHRPPSPALALVLLVMLLTCEWGHVSVHPTVWAQLILGNVHHDGLLIALSAQMGRLRQNQGRTHSLLGMNASREGMGARGSSGTFDSVSPSVKWAKPRASLPGW